MLCVLLLLLLLLLLLMLMLLMQGSPHNVWQQNENTHSWESGYKGLNFVPFKRDGAKKDPVITVDIY